MTILHSMNRNKIARIVLEYQAKTCIRMVPHKGETHHINFVHEGMVCSSPLGMQMGRNNVNLGYSCSWGSLAHEVMHSLGFFHEHTRSDRDNYITINWDAVPGTKITILPYRNLNGRLPLLFRLTTGSKPPRHCILANSPVFNSRTHTLLK